MKNFFRILALACAIGAFITLGLCSYCFYQTASFVRGTNELPATVIEVERTPADETSGRSGFHPVVRVAVAPGVSETHRFSGLYRVDSSAVGKPITLLYNAQRTPGLVPDSPWNWIGSIVYSSWTLALALLASLLMAATREAKASRLATVG